MHNELISKFQNRQAQIAIIGLGYVGLPLAVNFAQAGYRVVGIDLDPRKVDAINRGESYIDDIPVATVAALTQLPVALAIAEGEVLLDNDQVAQRTFVATRGQRSQQRIGSQDLCGAGCRRPR